jgi:prepilin-type N-terminal cleavage/methylation domain-containing protein
MTKRGFTLIELLVVIAIVGLLSSIVLSALGLARIRALDSVIAQETANIRSFAELYSLSHEGYGSQGYTGACSTNASVNAVFGDPAVQIQLDDAVAKAGYFDSLGSDQCMANSNGYMLVVHLASPNRAWCIDSKGNSREVAWTDHKETMIQTMTCP